MILGRFHFIRSTSRDKSTLTDALDTLTLKNDMGSSPEVPWTARMPPSGVGACLGGAGRRAVGWKMSIDIDLWGLWAKYPICRGTRGYVDF